MSTYAAFKRKVYQHFRDIITGKLDDLHKALQELIDSAANETKSTAGDKFETGRAMLHIEQDNIRRQLSELMAQKALFDRIDPVTRSESIIAGSLVKIANDYFYLSTSLGKVMLDGIKVISLSAQSPLGNQLMNKKAGEKVVMNGTELSIEEVL